MVGMSRPLQNLGINVKENAVEQLLLEMGINRTSQSLTEQQKIMARYITILKATKKDSGDLAHTYNSFTNVVRVLWSNVKILGRELGGPMKDAITGLAIRMRDWLINNREDIVAWWTTAMGKFQDFLSFFTGGTWGEGLKKGLEMLVLVLRAMVDSFVILGMRAAKAFAKAFGEELGKWLIEMGKPNGVLGKLSMAVPAIAAGRLALMKAGIGLIESARLEEPISAAEELKAAWSGVGDAIEKAATANENAKGLNVEEQKKVAAEYQKIRMARKAKTDQEIKDMEEQLRASLAADQEMLDAAKTTAEKIAEYWTDTGETINQVMYTARMSVKDGFAGMLTGMMTEFDNFEDHLRNFVIGITQAIARMQAEILAAKIMGSTESGGFGVGNWVNAGLNALAGGGGGQTVQAKARGGLIKPVYAANGFAPRGTDTVPVMATPGEGMLSKDLTAALREQLAVPGGVGGKSMTINVSAIDAQGTAQFLEKNKRQIAGFYGQTYRSNNPNTRRIR